MPPTREDGPTRRSALLALLLAAVSCGGFQLLFGNHNLNLRDEGYLWYGVGRVLAGEVPLRDFQAYDPGRYYWCAALSPLFGAGIVGVRASVALFEALGIVCGLLVVRRVLRHDAWMPLVTVLLLLWMFPRHKLFEPAITLIAVWSVTRLIERPSAGRHLFLGVVVGLAAVFGRNHGLYLGLVALLVTVLLSWRGELRPGARCVALGALGILLGYLPVLAMLALVPGFAPAFGHAVLSVLERGANLPRDYRWPWLANQEPFAIGLALDAAFLLPLVALPAGAVLVARTAREELVRRAPLVAATLVGVVYVHHFAVCSDLPHLAQAYPPVLLATLAIVRGLRAGPRLPAAALLVLLGVATGSALEGHTELTPFVPETEDRRSERANNRVTIEIAGETVSLKLIQAVLVHHVQAVVARHVGDEELFIAPTMPMWYPILGKRSPTWWIYFLWPATEEEQRETIDRLEQRGVRWALIIDRPLNDVEEYGFERTNPLVLEHLAREWEPVPDSDLPKSYHLFRRR